MQDLKALLGPFAKAEEAFQRGLSEMQGQDQKLAASVGYLRAQTRLASQSQLPDERRRSTRECDRNRRPRRSRKLRNLCGEDLGADSSESLQSGRHGSSSSSDRDKRRRGSSGGSERGRGRRNSHRRGHRDLALRELARRRSSNVQYLWPDQDPLHQNQLVLEIGPAL